MTYVNERPETNGRIKVPQIAISILLAVLMSGASGLVGYFRGTAEEQQKRSDLAADVRVLQEQVGGLRKQVDEMRADIRTLLARR